MNPEENRTESTKSDARRWWSRWVMRVRSLVGLVRNLWSSDRHLIIICGASGLLGIGFLILAIAPRYTDPSTRLYSTKFGYATLLRKQGKPFPVSSGTVARRALASRLQGEGLIATEPIQVPIIAMSRILKVHAGVGAHVKKGQLLVELDSRRAEVKADAARSAIKTAVAERERTLIGSSYILANERPDQDRIRLQSAQKMVRIREELMDIDAKIASKGASSRRDLLATQAELLLAQANLREEERALRVSEGGRKESIEIADSKLEEAKLALKHREIELEDYRVYSPCDGIIERCLVHDGEYNQDPGKPAFLINRDLWFEARMDQTAAGRVAVGDSANVYLEAFPNQPIAGRVAHITPSVSYDLGGPEATRPIRPLGSGAPEWPSTFGVRIQLLNPSNHLMAGLTGFARVESEREVIAVPGSALFARSGRSALVYVVGDHSYQPRKIVVGVMAQGWAEVISGLEPGEVVLTDGFQVLEPGDKVVVSARDDQPVDPPMVLEDADKSLSN